MKRGRQTSAEGPGQLSLGGKMSDHVVIVAPEHRRNLVEQIDNRLSDDKILSDPP